MFFYVSKIFWFFLQPSNAVLFLLAFGIVMLWSRWAWLGRWIALTSCVILLIGGLSPLGHALILPLENQFERAVLENGPPPAGIVILGGAQDMSITAKRGAVALNEAGDRLVEAAILARRYPDAKLVFTGGSSSIFGDKLSEAAGAKVLLTGLGVSPDRIVLEDRAKNTYQNAQFSKELMNPHAEARWILITSASHMPRAIGCFRAVSFKVEPWPVDYRTRGYEDIYRFFPKSSEGWRRIDSAVREWVGLFMYRLTGRTNSFFPGPQLS